MATWPSQIRASTVAVAGCDSTAIGAAIDQSRSGDTVYLPAGRYSVSQTIRPKSNTVLKGAGPGQTVVVCALSEPGSILSLAGRENVEVSDLTLDGNGDAKALQGISAGNARKLNLHHLVIRHLVKGGGFGPHGILFSGENPTGRGSVTDSRIADCVLESIGLGAEFGCGIRFSWGSSRNQVLRTAIRDTGRGGIFADNGSTDVLIQSNTVSGSGGEGLGIEVWGGCDRAVIEDNRIDHWLSFGGCDYGAARRNVVSDKSGAYKFCGIEAIGSYLVITDNVVDGGQKIGLSVSGSQPKRYCFWARNTIRGCNQWGAQLQGESGGMAYHYFHQCRFLSTPVGLGPVWYPGDEGHGFRVNGDVCHVTLEECESSGNGRLGLQLGGSRVDALCFRRCTIRDNRGAAVRGPQGYTALEWTDCSVEGNGDDRLPPAKAFSHPAPEAVFELRREIRCGEPVEPIGRCRVAHGQIAALLWDFGEGVPSKELRPRHLYDRPGRYRITLIAWDEAGRAGRATKEIEVKR
ncbi:MAG TPA: right-handed parallel beta-helix repeat-containing protein [Phycisphaerae bacterium]|nr:right-handed parallel beta-helix repeat-containing protein [Phycisphaerae bacterium]